MALFSEANLEFTPEEVNGFLSVMLMCPSLCLLTPLFKQLQPYTWVSLVLCMPTQMEFFGEDEVITVIPNITFPTADSSLICIGVRQLLLV